MSNIDIFTYELLTKRDVRMDSETKRKAQKGKKRRPFFSYLDRKNSVDKVFFLYGQKEEF